MEQNQILVSFLTRLRKKAPESEQESIGVVINSIGLCPIILNLEDSLDLIGVDEYIGKQLEIFFSGVDNYVPKEGSVSRQMLKALHESYPNKMTKSDILRAIKYRPPPYNSFRHKQFFGSWGSIKTLQEHGLVEKESGKPAKYFLTSHGKSLSDELFGVLTNLNDIDPSISKISIIANQNEIKCRASIDISYILRQTQIEWRPLDIPVGTFWFSNRTEIFDFLIQIATVSDLSNDSLKRRFSSSPFSRKVFLIPNTKETQTQSELKLRIAFEYGIEVVFCDSSISISRYISSLSKIIFESSQTVGNFDEVVKFCKETKFGQTVGSVWKEQIKLIPGVGPNLAANLAMRFKTPFELMEELEKNDNPEETLIEEILKRWGRRPRKNTVEAILRLFAGE
ncbi:small nuclear ribonucleoprotein E [Histomonas meleagridis]|uniref:small nuclear ribonucleoprotein E n=1 Tax=Histomonas meleagridis TaxID=135588 RepID=UPI00355A7502|nr:small nuclear ribonucleoprotein E [Histomonas meleagridis]KAH0796602.1 small nuclear ribonucleoprotein E [Histomonas meleagridis]